MTSPRSCQKSWDDQLGLARLEVSAVMISRSVRRHIQFPSNAISVGRSDSTSLGFFRISVSQLGKVRAPLCPDGCYTGLDEMVEHATLTAQPIKADPDLIFAGKPLARDVLYL